MGTGASLLEERGLSKTFNALDIDARQLLADKFEALKIVGKTDIEAFDILSAYEALKRDGMTSEDAAKALIAQGIVRVDNAVAETPCPSSGDYRVVIELTQLVDAIDAAVERGKTPLLVDNSSDGKVNTFFSYRSAIVIDGKKMVKKNIGYTVN
jgi:hypothetical protein